MAVGFSEVMVGGRDAAGAGGVGVQPSSTAHELHDVFHDVLHNVLHNVLDHVFHDELDHHFHDELDHGATG